MNHSFVRYSFEGPPTSGVIVRGAGYCCKDEHHKAVLAHCQEPSAKAILAEFVADIEAFGVEETEVEWPDLLVTYRKAKAFSENLNH